MSLRALAQSAITAVDVVIASGQTTSGAANLSHGSTLVAIAMPAAFTGTTLTFTGCDTESGTYKALYDDAGNAITVTCAASRYIVLDAANFAGVPYLKVVSGSSEGAERTLRLITRNV